MGNCGKPDVHPDVSPAIHHARATRMGPPRRRVAYRNTRAGFFVWPDNRVDALLP
jgi:hypothetical protein